MKPKTLNIKPETQNVKRQTSNVKPSGKPPIFIIIIFVLFGFAAVFNILNSQGLSPIDYVTAAVRDITGRPASNTREIVSKLKSGNNVVDTTDRCLVIDPYLEDPTRVYELKGGGELNISGENIGGLNQGVPIDSYQTGDQQEIFDKAVELGMSWEIGIIIEPTSADGAINFIEDAENNGLIPIIRLCVVGTCGFRGKDDIVDFYSEVADGTGTTFVAMVGPNEPGTGDGSYEMDPFIGKGFGTRTGDYAGDADYQAIVNVVNGAAEELSDYENMYLAPGAFNLTNGTNPDAQKFLEFGINLEYFDYLIGNSYGDSTKSAYQYYEEELKEKVDEEGMKAILTEFGLFDRPAGQGTLEQAKEDFDAFCADGNVDGVMFFRAYDGLPETMERHKLLANEIEDIISGCNRPPEGPTRDRARGDRTSKSPKDFSWQNCNFDSCVYEYTYDDKAEASQCGVEDPKPVTDFRKGALLKIKCEGGACTTKKRNTVEVSLPIKQFGSNTPGGTTNNAYTPICAEILEQISEKDEEGNIIIPDQFNQFAAPLTSSNGGPRYPMPWLGSALNCSSELIKVLFENSDIALRASEGGEDPTINLNPGSNISQTLEEAKDELESEFTLSGTSSLPQVDPDKILDERGFCVGDNESCIDKLRNSDVIPAYNEFNPLTGPKGYKFPEQCEDTDLVVRRENSNYIIGPEVYLDQEKTSWNGGGSEVCKLFARREIVEDPYPTPNDERFFGEGTISCTLSLAPECAGLTCRDGRPFYNPDLPLESQAYQGGDCYIDEAFQGCLQYNYNEEDSVWMYDKDYPKIPNYDLPGVYDSLYEMYSRLQLRLSGMSPSHKLIVKDNLGWEMLVKTKVRDVNREYGETEYAYKQSLSECSVPTDLFDNEYWLAKNNPIREKKVYFDWLGYLDILQEIQTLYTTNDYLASVKIVDNPYANLNGIPTTLDKPYILSSGASNLALRFSIFTCDDIEIAKYEGNLPSDFESTCLAMADDTRYKDELMSFLVCDKGYLYADGSVLECGEEGNGSLPICPAPTEPPEIEPVEPIEPIDGSVKLIYPVASPSISGEYGGGQYGDASARHTGMDFGGSTGEDIYASADGEVIFAGPDEENSAKSYPICPGGTSTCGPYGLMIRIRHENGMSTLYAHLSESNVEVGDQVKQGDVIAQMGSTGNSSGPHLHFELRKNTTCTWDGNNLGNCTLDPKPYITGELILPPGTPGGGNAGCSTRGPTPTEGSQENFECLLKLVAQSINEAVGYDVINAEILLAISQMEVWSRCALTQADWHTNVPAVLETIAHSSNGDLRPIKFFADKCSGNPNQTALIDPQVIDGAGKGIGQFMPGTFRRQVFGNTIFEQCVEGLGVDLTRGLESVVNPGDAAEAYLYTPAEIANGEEKYSRIRIGDSLCATAVKIIEDLKNAGGRSDYKPLSEWNDTSQNPNETGDDLFDIFYRYSGRNIDDSYSYHQTARGYYNIAKEYLSTLSCSGGTQPAPNGSTIDYSSNEYQCPLATVSGISQWGQGASHSLCEYRSFYESIFPGATTPYRAVDINGSANQDVFAPVSGKVTVVTPQNSDYTECFSDRTIYDGGEVVLIEKPDGQIFRVVHIENTQTLRAEIDRARERGEEYRVTKGMKIGEIYDGVYDEDTAYNGAGGCYRSPTGTPNYHLHLVIPNGNSEAFVSTVCEGAGSPSSDGGFLTAENTCCTSSSNCNLPIPPYSEFQN